MIIALTGPDGSGKSSICSMLKKNYPRSEIIYAGKSNFRLPITSFALNLWVQSRKLGLFISLLVQNFVYYPIEYLDSIIKFSYADARHRHVFFDRHPIDRMIMLHTLRLRRDAKRVTLTSYVVQYPLLWFWGKVYKLFFPRIDIVFVLTPCPELCFDRSEGQYPDLTEAKIKVRSYFLAMSELSKFQKVCEIKVSKNDSLQLISNQIISFMEKR